MKKRLFLYSTLIICLGLACFIVLSTAIIRANNISIAKNAVMEIADAYAGLYRAGADVSALTKTKSETRITVISPDGGVLADSSPLDVGSLDNHLDRPEIQAAQSGEPAASVRYSSTLGADLIYYAVKAESGDGYVFIRAAVPVAAIDAYLAQSLPFLIVTLVVVAAVCFVFSRATIVHIIRPFESVEATLRALADGAYTRGRIAGGYEEIDKLTRGIDDVAGILQNSFNELRDEKNKLAFIINSIADGLFVVDAMKNLILLNAAATAIFDAKPGLTGKNMHYLSHEKTFKDAVDGCLAGGGDAMFEYALNGRTYFVSIKKLPYTELTMVMLSDVTEIKDNARRREEFFANASHELKTPLTAIKGLNELTDINNKDENLRKYIESIARETDRMLSLIADMLKLSELENTQRIDINRAPVPLSKIIDEARGALATAIDEKAVRFTVSGDATVSAEPGHVYELVKNLIENAVRYNKQGGAVSVTVESDAFGAALKIADEGIGISSGEQARVFERFYRVEKSRSQKNGGTGLGLSIVKHICALYGWRLSLKSKPGAGTEVAVAFDGKPA